jgi:hypothetical protein
MHVHVWVYVPTITIAREDRLYRHMLTAVEEAFLSMRSG